MSIRVDSASLISGKTVVSLYAGHGIQAQNIPSTGTSGAGYLYNDIAAQGAAPTDEMRGELLTLPAAGALTVNEDSSFSFTGAPDGTYTFDYRGFRSGVSYGVYTVTLEIGAGAPVLPPGGTVTVTSVVPSSFAATVNFTYSSNDQSGFQYRVDGGTVVAAQSSPFVISGLSPSTSYSVQVRAVNSAGEGSWSASFGFVTLEYIPPDPSDTYQGRKLILLAEARAAYPTLTINDAMLLFLRNRYGVSLGLSDLIARYLRE